MVGINYTVCSEWLGYTLNVPQNGYYDVIVRGSTAMDGANFHLEKDFDFLTSETQFPNTGGWSNFQNDTISGVYMTQGTYQIKFVWDNEGINLDYLQFDAGIANGVDQVKNYDIDVYPNPFTNSLFISVPYERLRSVKLFDIASHLILQTNSGRIDNLSSLPIGIYYLKIETNMASFIKRVLKTN